MVPKSNPFLTFWRSQLIVDECPEEKQERIRKERIDNILINVAAREALRRWSLERERRLSFPSYCLRFVKGKSCEVKHAF